MLGRLLRGLSGAHGLSPGERAALVDYLIEELKIAVSKDREAAVFYESPKDLEATERFHKATERLVAMHSRLQPSSRHAMANYRAWHEAYQAYTGGISQLVSALRAGREPDPTWVNGWSTNAIQATKQTARLHTLLGISNADVLAMMKVVESTDRDDAGAASPFVAQRAILSALEKAPQDPDEGRNA